LIDLSIHPPTNWSGQLVAGS